MGSSKSHLLPTRAFLDTEFVQTREGVVFISVGLVTNCGHEFYSELSSDQVEALAKRRPNKFIQREVIPQLGIVPGVPWGESPKHFAAWLEGLGAKELEVIYDFNADFLLIEQMLASLAHSPAVRLIPSHVGYLLDDADGEIAAAVCWGVVAGTKGVSRHHALADAYALRARFESVHGPMQLLMPGPAEHNAQNTVDKQQTCRIVEAVVTVLIPEFSLVHLDGPHGHTFSIGEDTDGVDWKHLEVGDRLLLQVDAEVSRVLHATRLPPSKDDMAGNSTPAGPTV